MIAPAAGEASPAGAEQVHVTLWVFAKMGTQPEEPGRRSRPPSSASRPRSSTKMLAMMGVAYATLDRRPAQST